MNVTSIMAGPRFGQPKGPGGVPVPGFDPPRFAHVAMSVGPIGVAQTWAGIQ
jgi:hypothetical protein